MSTASGSPAGPPTGPAHGLLSKAWAAANGQYRSIVLAYALTIVMFLITTAFTPGFGSANHIKELLIEASFIGIAGLGQTFVIIGGGVDLSIPYVFNAAGTVMSVLASSQDGSLIWVLPVVACLAMAVGLVNGVAIAVLGISPIIMTLGMNVIVEGLLLVVLGGSPVDKAPGFIVDLALNNIGPIPVDTLLWLALAAAATVGLSWTSFGRRLYAVGTSRIVAEFSGINVAPIVIATYVISALASAVAGLLYTGFVDTAYLGMGDSYLFASVAAVAVGGTALVGGGGHYLGTIAGALVLTVLDGLLPILNLDPGALQIIYGLTILATVALATVRIHGART